LPTPDEARTLWTDKHVRELREAMQSGSAFEAFLPIAQEMMARDDGRVLIAYALKYFFTHTRMEKAQLRQVGEKLIESHQVEKMQKEQKAARRPKEREHRKPKLEASAPSAPAPAAAAEGETRTMAVDGPATPAISADRVKLYVEQGSEQGWTSETLLSALAELAGQTRATALAADVKPRYAYVLVQPGAHEAYVAASGKNLNGKPVRLEVARPKRR
jgi:ATP-dependent RNA helicase DeaD